MQINVAVPVNVGKIVAGDTTHIGKCTNEINASVSVGCGSAYAADNRVKF